MVTYIVHEHYRSVHVRGKKMSNYIYYDASDIDSIVTAAMLQTAGYGKAVRYIDELTKVNNLYVLNHVCKLPHAENVVMFYKTDIRTADLNDPEMPYQKYSYLQSDKIRDMLGEDLDRLAVYSYQILLVRLMKCDSHMSDQQMAVLYDIYEKALHAVKDGEDFELDVEYDSYKVVGFHAFLASMKKLVSEKLHHRKVDLTKTVFGLRVSREKYVNLGVVNADISMTAWIAKLASYSLHGIIVFEYDRVGTMILAHQVFSQDGEEAYDKLVKNEVIYA